MGGSSGRMERSNMQPCSPVMGIAHLHFFFPFPLPTLPTTLPFLLFCVIPPHHLTPHLYLPLPHPLSSTPHHSSPSSHLYHTYHLTPLPSIPLTHLHLPPHSPPIYIPLPQPSSRLCPTTSPPLTYTPPPLTPPPIYTPPL